MKRILLIYIYFLSNSIFSQNVFDANVQSVNHNTNFSIVIGLNNSSQVTAFQFDIDYDPNAFDLLSGHTLTSRAPNHMLSASNLDYNTIRVIVFSTSNQLISAGSGPVVNLFCVSKNLPGTYNLSFSNIVLSGLNGAQVAATSINGGVTVMGPKYNLNTNTHDFGAIPIGSSPSHNVSISNGGNTDLIITSYNLNTPFTIQNAFPITIGAGSSISIPVLVNTDTKQEVSEELTFVTNDSDPLRALQKKIFHADIFAVNEIYIGSGSGASNTQITIPVSFSNMEMFSGFQFDITLPSNVSYVPNSCIFTSRSNNHSISANMVSSNVLRFVAFSSTNANFTGNTGEVFSFKILPNLSSGTYGLTISNPIISNPSLGDITSGVYNGSLTINAPTLTTNVQFINYGRVPITETRSTQINLTNSGSATLLIDQLVYDTSTLAFPLTLPLSIDVGNNTSTNLTFSPSTVGLYDKNLFIINNSPQQQKIINVQADVFSPNYLRIVDQTVFANDPAVITLKLSNNDPIRGLQFDLAFPTGFVFDSQNIIATSVLNNFNVSVSDLGSNVYRFVIFTFSNNTITAGDQTILNLPVFVQSTVTPGSYPFPVTNVVLSSQSNQNIASEALSVGVISVVPKCIPPSNFNVSSITTNSATVSWISGGSGESTWNIEYKATTDFTPGTSSAIAASTTTNSYNLSCLSSGTVYYYYVKANCDSEDSAWSGPFNFTTGNLCAATLYDSGGVSSYYSNNESTITTVYPDSSGYKLSFSFLSFNTQLNYDKLWVYDGPDEYQTVLIDGVSGTTIPPNVTSSHPTGALTLKFVSDSSITRPGYAISVSCSDNYVKWLGTNGTNWETASNWSTFAVPNTNSHVLIPSCILSGNTPVIATDVSVASLITASALSIDPTGSLIISEDFTNTGTVSLNSTADLFSSIIVQGTSTGEITYNRFVNHVGLGEWDLIGSPVEGVSISAFATLNDGPLATNGIQFAIGRYNNFTDVWTNYTTTTIVNSGNFDIGKGYKMGSDSGATLAFTGTIATSDQNQAVINNDAANMGVGRRWNLVSNPFPSYLNLNNSSNATDNFISINSDKLDDVYEAVYGFDADGTGYTIYNHTYNGNAPLYIAPGQGFMIASDDVNGEDIVFTESMQTVLGDIDFVNRNLNNYYEFSLQLFHGDLEKGTTRFYFQNGLSTGLNPGYDAGSYDQNSKLMSRLIVGDQGHGLSINAMGLESMDGAIVPLEINQNIGDVFSISLNAQLFDPTINVYLEDVQNGTITLLNGSDFQLTATNTISGIGRFYLHITPNTLSNEVVNTRFFNIYKANENNYITIEGLSYQSETTFFKVYDLLGKEVVSTQLYNNTNTQFITTENLQNGIYIAKLTSGVNQLIKKIIVK